MPPMNGNTISGEFFLRNFNNLGFGAEIIYSFVIIICSLMIYFGTKELYELSNYKGIKYFREAFLFFAIAYFFRSFIKFVVNYFNVSAILDISQREFGFAFGQITLLIFVYFSSMAIFYLLYSVMYKKWEGNSKVIYLFHMIALIIAIISILFPNPLIHLSINLIFLIIFSIIAYVSHKHSLNKKGGLYIVYILLLVFWILNIIDILIPKFLQTYQLAIYLSSTGIFLYILYKVLKRAGN